MKHLKKIAICGAQGLGKTTLLNDFVDRWRMFSTPEKSYRDLIKSDGLKINKNGNKDSQRKILDFLCHQTSEKYEGKMVFDRCPLDNLVYSIWLYEKGISDIDDEFIAESVEKVRESFRSLDIIFFIPLTKLHTVEIDPNKTTREIDPIYQQEIDSIFKAFIFRWKNGDNKFFPKGDCPPIIDVFGERDQRLAIMSMYITDRGEMYGEEESLIAMPPSRQEFTVEDFK